MPLSRPARFAAAALRAAGSRPHAALAQAPEPASAAPIPRHRPPHQAATGQSSADRIGQIRVEGNQRIETGTILSYMSVAAGDPFDPDRLDRSLKTLYATGLFSDVKLDRLGDTLIVRVHENPIVNQIAFEGNHRVEEDKLRDAITLRPRAVFSAAQAEADRDKLLALYAQKGRFAAKVTPKIIRLADNRVNVVFEIEEGRASLIAKIVFVGNHSFSESRLREVISSRETAWWRLLSSADEYDPDRINYDRELLRRFYLRNGFIDFAADEAHAELSPDRGGFFVTFTIHEGIRYKIANIRIDSELPHLDGKVLRPDLQMHKGDWYDGDAVERTVTVMSDDVRNHGYAFVDVEPRIVRNEAQRSVDLVFQVTPGDRVYVERIDIVGNTRTKDSVIRREFRLAEGDAYSADLVHRSKQRIQDLGYFSKVQVDTAQGSAPDKAIVTATVTEKSTGQLTLGGGYSTQVGALLNAGLSQKNFIGSGIDAGINATIGYYENQIDLNVTDPYFLNRNLVAGFDIFHIDNNNQYYTVYSERRTGAAVNLGYQFNEHVRQSWTYTIVDRNVYNAYSGASLYITSQEGQSILSQIGQTFTIDYRDSQLHPHKGWIVRLGTDYAGLGGTEHFVRGKLDGSYFVPLDAFFHNDKWDIEFSAGIGKLWDIGSHQETIVDRFFLGGDNLRGFQPAGVGPRDLTDPYEDAIGGRFIWTQSTELHYPLPLPEDFGVSGRAFVDTGALQDYTRIGTDHLAAYTGPRVGAGVGISWNSPFGLINIDIADAVKAYPHDKVQVFRFGFGTGF